MYYIVNVTDKKIEAMYEGELYANFMCRNFLTRHPTKTFLVMTQASSMSKRPTNAQLYRIQQIEGAYKIPFNGITKDSASQYLDKYISKTKILDEEIAQIRSGIK